MEEGLLRNAAQEQSFHLANGRVLKNLHELSNALISMDEKTFSHHVTKDRNDFSNWILGVFRDEELSRQIAKNRNRESMQGKLSDALKAASKKVQPASSAPSAVAPIQKPAARKPSAMERISKLIPKKKEHQAAPSNDPKPKNDHEGINKKLDLILSKEKEIEFKEKKLLEIEEKLEKKLLGEKDHSFFSKEFVQGLVTGFLITLIVVLAYVKFIVQA